MIFVVFGRTMYDVSDGNYFSLGLIVTLSTILTVRWIRQMLVTKRFNILPFLEFLLVAVSLGIFYLLGS